MKPEKINTELKIRKLSIKTTYFGLHFVNKCSDHFINVIPYGTDYNPQDWVISLSELLRIIQFYNSLGYHFCPTSGTEDGFCPGVL